MKQDWWHVYVNEDFLVSINGFETAMEAFQYFKKDTNNTYTITQVKKESEDKKDVEPVKWRDIISNSRNI